MRYFCNRVVLVSVIWAFLSMPSLSQNIMRFEQYQNVNHKEPYIYQIEANTGTLLYFGSRHSYDPDDPQLDTLINRFNRFAPDMVLTEAFPHTQLMLFYTLNQVAQNQGQRPSLNFSALVPKYLASLKQRFNLNGPTIIETFEKAVQRLQTDVNDWQRIARHYFYPGPQDPEHFTNRISTDSNIFRDRHHVNVITQAVKKGQKVFIIVGSAHAVMQEPKFAQFWVRNKEETYGNIVTGP
ncbi:MAG: hypothetical protein GF313_08815 [Caldithrix sp.]|nr:hypothetical protein [Caldithrix sp.]